MAANLVNTVFIYNRRIYGLYPIFQKTVFVANEYMGLAMATERGTNWPGWRYKAKQFKEFASWRA